MGRIIKRSEIRKGDKIVIKRTVEVGTDLDSDGDFKTPDGEWVEFDAGFDDDYEIELLYRESPPLPTEPGSVIRVHSNSGSGRWILTRPSFGGPVWVSAAKVNYTPDEMIDFLERREDRTFEVLL
ncbi:hypothetical protein SEA_HORTUS1_9 [Microbacterium phage Hortus1]|nr:hypothetical protein SEA_HORTUS1_9 [Microbacterium phage Hortus1]AWY05583.1 hypothetical protein SEA_OLINDD_9 [Microbacterium phage OlinDD]